MLNLPRKRVVQLVALTIALWALGLFDKLFETSFEEFSWPGPPTKNFEYPHYDILPKCGENMPDTGTLYIIIKSSVGNYQQRDAIRKTWGKQKLVDQMQIVPIFMVGRKNDVKVATRSTNVSREIREEAETYHDILAIAAVDSYRNNTYKLFASINFASSPSDTCSPPDYVLLVDDDYMVHMPNLVKFAKTKSPRDFVYEGHVFNTSPFRFVLHKHRISLEEYPFSRYPPYVSAGAVFLTRATVSLFQSTIPELMYFPFDDVYTGIVAKMAHVPATHNANFIFWSRIVSREEWKGGMIAVHGYTSSDLLKSYRDLYSDSV